MKWEVEVEKSFKQTTTIQNNLEEEPKPNLDQVIDNIQVEPIESIEFVILITEPTQPIVVVAKLSQPIQPIVEHVHVKNPQFSISQPILVFGHFINNHRQFNMFLEEVAQNATTQLKTLQEFANVKVEFEQSKENLFETHNCLQTCSLELKIMNFF